MDKKIQHKTDWIELLIVLAIIFLIIAIYVPVAIWADEDHYTDLSHLRMENVYDIERFYAQLTNEYNQNGYEAMHMIRKGQIRGVDKGNIQAQNQFIAGLFGLGA